MTAQIINIRDYRRKEEKAVTTQDQIEAEVMASLFGVPANFVIGDAGCNLNSTPSQIASSPIGSSES